MLMLLLCYVFVFTIVSSSLLSFFGAPPLNNPVPPTALCRDETDEVPRSVLRPECVPQLSALCCVLAKISNLPAPRRRYSFER
uniref:Putative secreted protein n=1 Tax=Anopheles darlingi TaxID=43151 RepID=A0A2M4DPX0_ANODA